MFENSLEEEIHISDYLIVLSKRKWLIGLFFLLTLAFSVFFTARAVPVYQASATMIIDNEQGASPITGLRTDYESYYSESLTFNTHFKLILSSEVVQRVIDVLHLGEKTPETLEGAVTASQLGQLKQLVKTWKQNLKSMLNIEPPPPPTFQEERNNLVRAVKTKVSIDGVEETRLLKISVKDIDPEQAAEIANALARQYIQFNLSNRMDSSKETLAWMNNELYHLKKKLEDDEKSFFEFKQEHKLFSITGKQKMTDQKLKEFNSSYLDVRNRRLDLDTKIGEVTRQLKKRKGQANVRSLINNPTMDRVYAKLKELEIEHANLSKVYKQKHPKIIQITEELAKSRALLADELKKELASLKSERSVLYSRENVLKKTLGEFEEDALNASGNELEYSILQRNLNTSQHLYDTLLSKIKESNLLQTSDTSNVRIVEEAMPSFIPVSPKKKRNYLLAAVLGIAGGIGIAFLLEYMDQTIRTEEDILNYLNLPVLSVIPKADTKVEYGSRA